MSQSKYSGLLTVFLGAVVAISPIHPLQAAESPVPVVTMTPEERQVFTDLDARPIQSMRNTDLGQYLPLREKAIATDSLRFITHEEIGRMGRRAVGQAFRINAVQFDLAEGDCISFVNRTLALSLAKDWDSYYLLTERIRHKDGVVNYRNRNFFTLGDWLPSNAWLLDDVTAQLGPAENRPAESFTHVVRPKVFDERPAAPGSKFMRITFKGSDYMSPDKETRTDSYVPTQRIPEVLRDLRTGDVVLILRPSNGGHQASDPFNTTYDYGEPPEVPPISITPASGLLRIWTKTGSASRSYWSTPGGDYVAPDTYPASALGLSSGTREVSLWLEGINPGQAQVVFELDPDGDGPADFVHSDAFRVTVLKVAIVNPTGPSWVYDSDMGRKTPRIMTPANAPLFSGNEFTYSDAYPDGVLTVPVFIQIEPDTAQIRALFENKIRTRVSAINDSHLAGTNVQLTWDHPFPGEPTAGKAMYGDPLPMPLWQATATFTKLPPDNEDFGLKTLTVDFLGEAGNIVCSPRTREYEIFFARDATNHPDLPDKDDLDNFSATDVDTVGHGDSTRSQNWFFYWNRTAAGDPDVRFASNYHDSFRADVAVVPTGYAWLTSTAPKDRIVVSPVNCREYDQRQDGSAEWVSGIDLFANVVLHENRHVLQCIEHDALNPYDVSAGGSRVGYSVSTNGFLIPRTRGGVQNGEYNHFRAGPDDQPGDAGKNDDPLRDNEIDERDEFLAGPFDPSIPLDQGSVVGDDEDLDRDGDLVSHLVPTDPDADPNVPDYQLWEKQADARETSPQDTHRQVDWASPGKQHGPDLDTPNDLSEINRYDD